MSPSATRRDVPAPSRSDATRLGGLLDLLAHSPTPHELLRFLIHSPLHTPAPRAGALGMIADSAELVELASYGLTRPHGFTDRQSAWQHVPPFLDFGRVTPVRRDVRDLRSAVQGAGIPLDPEPWAQSVLIQAIHTRRSTPIGAVVLLFDVGLDVTVESTVRHADLHAALVVACRSEPFRSAQQEIDTRLHGGGPLLTDREQTCLRLVARGRSNKEIAAQIRLSPSTVKVTLSRVFDKLEVTRRREAVETAQNLGLL